MITIEEGSTLSTDLEITEGLQFDKGYLSPYFVTDAESMEAVLEDAYVLLHRDKISSIADLLPLLEKVLGDGKPLLIVAEDVEGEALSTLVVNSIRKTLRVAAVKSPFFGDRRKAFMDDLAIATGGTVINPEVGLKLSEAGIDLLGTVRRVVVTKDNTTLVEGGGSGEAVEARVAQLKREIEDSDSDWDREKLQERLAKLSGGVAVIKVGAATETALKERKHRIEDAVSATRAAVEEGVIPGGGSALIHAAAVARRRPRPEGRRGHRRGGRPQGAHLAAVLDRRQRRSGGLGRHQQGGRPGVGPRLQRRHDGLRRPDGRWRHRPRQGHAQRGGQRRVDRADGADHRERDRRQARATRRLLPRAVTDTGTATRHTRTGLLSR